MSVSTLYTQNLVPNLNETVSVIHLHHRDCRIIRDALDVGSGTKVFGVTQRLSKRGSIEAIALATPTTVFLISLSKCGAALSIQNGASSSSHDAELLHILQDPRCLLAGAGIARLALLLHRNTGAHVRGAELLTLPAKSSGKPISPADLASTYLSSRVRHRGIHALWLRNSNNDICLKAWLLACVAEKAIDKIAQLAKAETGTLHAGELSCLSQLILNIELLDADKPTCVENEFDNIAIDADGHAVLRNARFKTRVRASRSTVIEINGGEAKAQAVTAKGKSTGLAVFKGKLPTKVQKVRIIGREEATNAERGRDDYVLSVLQGSSFLNTSPFVQMLWFELSDRVATVALPSLVPKKGVKEVTQVPAVFQKLKLNPSQRKVAMAMISYTKPLVVAHGPPGTGKTSTIAAALEHWQGIQQAAWVVAQSNVGVQNIAESLFKRKIDFKIIVSQEFHFEWHEHLYEEIEHLVIRTDYFGHGFDPKNGIGSTKVILCTLSMLSNPSLHLHGIFKHVPVVRLIVDEASQIDTFEFMHLFDMFSRTLGKVCMFGDPNQLPPFGAEVAPKMKTIFDFKHLKKQAYFLDTQYRMPVPLGDFISKAVYDSRLKSHHKIKDNSCVLFVDVRKGQEERAGSSWKNTEEVHTIVNIAKKYYKSQEFCVITPYDAQRGAITAALKAAGVARCEHVYNVDSFQGHEAPYIIVSSVRTSAPGFLRSLNRLNVMLTRCKAGMVLVTKRAFLHNAGQKTLLGKLAKHWESRVGMGIAWADAMEVADRRVSLPGAPGKNAQSMLGSSSSSIDTLVDRMGGLEVKE